MNFTNLKNFMDYRAEAVSPGNAVEVYLGGKKVFQYACGYSDWENQIPMTGEEMFNIYSCSKITTVTAGTQLLERGRFLLTDPLYEYIPEFKEMYIKTENGELKKAENCITVGDLFGMTAGFTYKYDTEGFKRAREVTQGRMDTVETIKCVAKDPLSFEPGTRFQYSICHDVLAALISVVSGQKFRDYVQENIFDPLGMKDTTYHHTPETLERLAWQYERVAPDSVEYEHLKAQVPGDGSGRVFKNAGKKISHDLGEEYDNGGAGITTTVSEYVKLMAALANYGMGLNGERILSGYSVNLIRTNRLSGEALKAYAVRQSAGCGYGLGVRTHIDLAKSGCISNLGEFGWSGAAGATALIDPKIGLGVFYVQHMLRPDENRYLPMLKNVVYSCLDI